MRSSHETPLPGPSDDVVQPLRVLIVEDDMVDYEEIGRCLRTIEGYRAEVAWAKNRERARLLLARNRFDIVFVDYHIGLDTGSTLMQEFGGRFAPFAMILVTHHANRRVQQLALSAGAMQCLRKKDVNPESIEAAISYSLHTHALEQRLYAQLIAHKQAQNAFEQKLLRLERELEDRAETLTRSASLIDEAGSGVEAGKPLARQAQHIRAVAAELSERATAISGLLAEHRKAVPPEPDGRPDARHGGSSGRRPRS